MIDKFESFMTKWGRWFSYVSMVGIAFLLSAVVVDIVGTKVFNHPLKGSLDIIGLLGLILTSFALAHTHLMGRNIMVDFVVMRLPKRAQDVLAFLVSIMSLCLWALVFFSMLDRAERIIAVHEGSKNLELPMYPFAYIIAFGIIPLFFVIVVEMLKAARRMVGR